MATLFMNATNSVRQFMWATRLILTQYIPHEVAVYLDNVEIKDPKTKYNKKEMKLNIRKYVLKYL